MADKGTPNEGRDLIAGRVYLPGLQLRAYVNLQDSLTPVSVLADIVEPTGPGYAPITLTDTWTSVNGIVTYDGPDPFFQNSAPFGGSNWSSNVTGVWMTDGVRILHFSDLISAGGITMTPQYKLTVDLTNLVAN